MRDKNLSVADVEHVLVSALEEGLAEYQGNEAWRCITNALAHLKEISEARRHGQREPKLPSEQWARDAAQQNAREEAWKDAQMTMNPSSLRRTTIDVVTALHVWTADGRIVGMWQHPQVGWIEEKEKQMRAMGEGFGWVYEKVSFSRLVIGVDNGSEA